MAPKRGQSIERTAEHDAFINKLRIYHDKRGTTLDTEPRVGIRHIDLYKLYERVVEEGGYDLASDTKAKPLMWRRLAEEFVGKNQYTAAQAFQIKNVYYKNLCAYEISVHWGKEPPPKEILEDVTAKGGGVMTRTLENFVKFSQRESDGLPNGYASDSGKEHQTPKDEKSEPAEDPGSASARTRSLRQQPPQRVLFQPEVSSARQPRAQQQPSQYMGSPNAQTPFGGGLGPNGSIHSSLLSNAASATLASYEPPQSYPLSLKPIATPSNNPEFYVLERKRKAEAAAGPLAKKYRNIMLPGTGFIGPNIYIRAQLALQSGLADEERYALHHLVKISHERGDKYRFDQFPGLAEALAKKVLQVCSLFYDVDWDISFLANNDQIDEEVLDGLNGTSDILQRLHSRMPLVTNDDLRDSEFMSQIGRITEASLVIRNMCLQVENAQYIARQTMMTDYFAIILSLPSHPNLTELQYYVLDTAEQVLVWCNVGGDSTIYESLIRMLWSEDRGIIIAALKVIARLSMNLPVTRKLEHISLELLERVERWLMVEDEELRGACLDFLFRYTSFSENVATLCRSRDPTALSQQLSRLLLFAARKERAGRLTTSSHSDPPTNSVARLSRSLIENLLKLDEPERSSEWLRMCFLPEPNSEMTQISLWQAYQGTFAPFHSTHPHLIAGDFIKNVSATFTGATAQVAGANKYVIKGIKARRVPIDTGTLSGAKSTDRGKELYRCCWASTVTTDASADTGSGTAKGSTGREVECSDWFKQSDDMLRHILREHLRIPYKAAPATTSTSVSSDRMDVDPKPNGISSALTHGIDFNQVRNSFDFLTADRTQYYCRWGRCGRRSSEFEVKNDKASRTALFARHIQTHLPDSQLLHTSHNVQPDAALPSLTGERSSYVTLTDERGEAAGLGLSAALILRNIAKFMPSQNVASRHAVHGQSLTNGQSAGQSAGVDTKLMSRVFDEEVMDRLFFAVTHSKTMSHVVGLVLRCVFQHLKLEDSRAIDRDGGSLTNGKGHEE